MSEILFTAPLAYETGNPITPPSSKGSRFRVDLVDGRIYQWDSGPDVWRLFAQGLDPLPNTSAPAYIPGIGQSAFAITTDRKLYFYSGGAWNLIPVQGATGPAGPNGAAGPTGPQGTAGVTGAAGQGVPVGGTAGQVLSKIDGTNYNTAWAADKNGIYSGSGGIPAGTVSTIMNDGVFAIKYTNGNTAMSIDADQGSILFFSGSALASFQFDGNNIILSGSNVDLFGKIIINGPTGHDQLTLTQTYTPTSSADPNGANGAFAYDATHFYIKVGGIWKSSPLSTL